MLLHIYRYFEIEEKPSKKIRNHFPFVFIFMYEHMCVRVYMMVCVESLLTNRFNSCRKSTVMLLFNTMFW